MLIAQTGCALIRNYPDESPDEFETRVSHSVSCNAYNNLSYEANVILRCNVMSYKLYDYCTTVMDNVSSFSTKISSSFKAINCLELINRIENDHNGHFVE